MSRTRIDDSDFEDWLQLNDDHEDTNWLAQQAALGLPLMLPWKKQRIRLGTCFQSRLQHQDPWLKSNPFILSDLYRIPKVLELEYGSTSTFHSISTSRQSETSDHLSLGFGMGVGLPFLCEASVKGSYDEDVKKNDDSDKSSIRASARVATVKLQRNPRLSHEAMVKLKYDGGYPAFTEIYGDYFVWGYRIGGDTGFMLSSSSFSNKKVETYGIKATLEVLLVSVSKEWTKDVQSFSAGKAMKLLGYDTLSDKRWAVTTAGDGIQQLVDQGEKIIASSQSLYERTLEILSVHNIDEGDDLTHEQCDFLTESGLAVELILLPMSALRDVARWTTEHDVI